jgi:hypothetical protein
MNMIRIGFRDVMMVALAGCAVFSWMTSPGVGFFSLARVRG